MSSNPTESTFQNSGIDLDQLPKYENIILTSPSTAYWKVICINLIIFELLLGTGVAFLVFKVEELKPHSILFACMYSGFAMLLFLLYSISFKKRGYAVRNHDILYKSGIIAESTTIIPLNRIQHIELNEGIVSRIFKLAALQIYTAGGQTGHLRISGIPSDQAKSIRDLLLKKLDLTENKFTEPDEQRL